MALNVGVDSYLGLAGADAYWAARNDLDWEAADPADKEKALREATQYLDGRFDWVGSHPGGFQALGWPRLGAFDHEGRHLTGVPAKVQDATAELAREALSGRLVPAEARGGRTRREKVGALEVEYQDMAPGGRGFAFVALLLRGLVKGDPGVHSLVRA